MISVITPTYETNPDILARTWTSLKNQTHNDWEWVVWDDSNNDDVFRQVYGYCNDERYKIQLHRSPKNIGIIGMVKLMGFSMADGDILVELDHDDELTPNALDLIDKAFLQSADIGFVYSNWCEINERGESCRYPEGWAFGYGSDYWDEDNNVWVMRAPELNATTMGHIVSAPNHVRAWRASTYRSIGGHNPTLRVADDYELMVRTILNTDAEHIDLLLYKQYINEHTAQRVYNAEIQERVAEISAKYKDQIEARYA
jgi:glycosyltransferase involved in cell wall biosynthesis